MITKIQISHSILKRTHTFCTCAPTPGSLHRQGVLNPEEKCLLVTGCSQHIGVLHQMLLIVPGTPDSAEGALLAPPRHSDQADHGGSQQDDEDHHEQPRQDHH